MSATIVCVEIKGLLTAGNHDEEAKSKDCAHSNLVFEFHLQSGDHGDGKADDDNICEDVD
jgi:hypothetical protein